MNVNHNHSESILFDIVSLGSVPVILGLPWLRKHNPSITWSPEETLKFNSSFCLQHCCKPFQSVSPDTSLARSPPARSPPARSPPARQSSVESNKDAPACPTNLGKEPTSQLARPARSLARPIQQDKENQINSPTNHGKESLRSLARPIQQDKENQINSPINNAKEPLRSLACPIRNLKDK